VCCLKFDVVKVVTVFCRLSVVVVVVAVVFVVVLFGV